MALLKTEGLTKNFGGLTAIDDLDMAIERGGITGLIGPNGAGKTTLLNMMSGALSPSRGDIHFKGEKISGLKPHVICKKGMARTFQDVKILGGVTVLDNVILALCYGSSRRRSRKERNARAMQLLEFTGMADKASVMAKELTMVDQKLVELSRALATEPELLLLDEVITGLNPGEIGMACDLIRNINHQGTTVVMVEHVMPVIMSMCDDIIVLNYGRKIAQDGPEAVCRNEKVVEIYLGDEAECSR